MGGLFLILPIAAFDLWLACTTGRRQVAAWRAQKNWRQAGLATGAGVLLAVWLAFFVKYGYVSQLRFEGFPVPVVFFHLEGGAWTRAALPAPLRVLGMAANFLTGLVAPFLPFKIAEFLKVVKAELK